MPPIDKNVVPLLPKLYAKIISRIVDEMIKMPLKARYDLMSINACQDPDRLKECMAEVCRLRGMAPDYLKWPDQVPSDLRLLLDAVGTKGPNTGFERALYFWMNHTDFCSNFRSTPYGAMDVAEESALEAVVKENGETLERGALIALAGKVLWDYIGAAAPVADAAMARLFPFLIPRFIFEKPRDPSL